MNVSQTSGASAAWMLRKLFQSDEADTSTTPASGAERQKMPGAGSQTCNSGGASSPQMSSGTTSVMISIQMNGTPPSASDIASKMTDALDTNGDGEVSAEEIAAAFSGAGLDTKGIADALKQIDTDGNGKLSKDELTSAVSSRMASQGAEGPHHGGHHHGGGGHVGGASEAASSILAAFDTDDDTKLSLAEIQQALGEDKTTSTTGSSALSSVFASLDSDGDGLLSGDELTSAIQQNMQNGYRAYAQAAEASAMT